MDKNPKHFKGKALKRFLGVNMVKVLAILKKIESLDVSYVPYNTRCPICKKKLRTCCTKADGQYIIRYLKCTNPFCLGSINNFKTVSSVSSSELQEI